MTVFFDTTMDARSSIWNRQARHKISAVFFPHEKHLAGRTYDAKDKPSIGMHPNAGITFDLDAIRNAMPEARIDRFTARCGVSENVVRFAQRDADPNTIEVTFWVLVREVLLENVEIAVAVEVPDTAHADRG